MPMQFASMLVSFLWALLSAGAVVAETPSPSDAEAEAPSVAASDENTETIPGDAPHVDETHSVPDSSVDAQRLSPSASDEDPRRPIPLTQNYSWTEISVGTAALGLGAFLVVLGSDVMGEPTPSMGPPARGSLDYRISMKVHGDLSTGDSLLYGIPDMMGAVVLPVVPTAYYLGASTYYELTGNTVFEGQGPNLSHSAMGYVTTMGWTLLATGAVKHLVGRTRPYSALHRPQFAAHVADRNTSFFSGHSATAFATASFLAWDLSDHLVHHVYRNEESAFLVGRLLPFAGLYGVAGLTAFSRIYDQKHYFSDVVVGSLVGALIGNLVYLTHFDDRGQPRVQDDSTAFRWTIEPTLARGKDASEVGLTLSSIW